VKIVTANVNGIRSAQKKGFFEWMDKIQADVVCVQEIKASEDVLDDSFYPKGIFTFYKSAVKKGYSGTGLYCKSKPDRVIYSPWDDFNDEGRFIQADFGDLSVISIYIPSGSAKQERHDYKMDFLKERFLPYLQSLQDDGRKYIITGDFNMVHKRIDIKNFNGNKKRSGCTEEERDWMENLLTQEKFIDGFRELNQEAEQYTWWSNRGQAYANNTGWRIDYHILSNNLRGAVESVEVYKDIKFSDHAPLIVQYNF
jgi:exodeoxyribonuclease-3